jgi:hypothetical protein
MIASVFSTILILDDHFSIRYSLSGKSVNTIPSSVPERSQRWVEDQGSVQAENGRLRIGYATCAIGLWLAVSDISSFREAHLADRVVSIDISEGSQIVHHPPGKREKSTSCA